MTAAEGPQKWEVHGRKFAALSDDSEFQTALIPQLMPEDEDKINEEGRLTGRYISCPWVWASEQVSNDWAVGFQVLTHLVQQRNQFIAAVDAQQDPHPPKRYTIRVRGETLEVTIPRIQKVGRCARRWIVSQEWLAQPENQKYDVPAFIVDDGKTWGDPKEPYPPRSVSRSKRKKST